MQPNSASRWLIWRLLACHYPVPPTIRLGHLREHALHREAGAMTMLLYSMNDTWEILVSPGKTVREEEFRIAVLWIATQMQIEFDLRN